MKMNKISINTFSVRAKLIVALMGLSLIPLVLAVSYVYYYTYEELEHDAENQLKVIRDLKAYEIENFFAQMAGQARTMSRAFLIEDSMQLLPSSFAKLGLESIDDTQGAGSSEVDEVRKKKLQKWYKKNIKSNKQLWSENRSIQRVQELYIVDNPFGGADSRWLDDAGDGSEYSRLHKEINPLVNKYIDEFGYHDVFLVDNYGNVVYTALKDISFGTNLVSGPHSGSGLARTFKNVMRIEDPDGVLFSDLITSEVLIGEQVGFVASPVFDEDGERRLGVLLLQYSRDQIDLIMHTTTEVSETSEAILIGEDFKLRSTSRFFTEQGFDKADMYTKASQASISGKKGVMEEIDYRGIETFVSYTPLNLPNLNWVLHVKMDHDEALKSARKMLSATVVMMLLLTVMIVFISFFSAKSIVDPITKLGKAIKKVKSGDLSARATIETHDEIGVLADDFNSMVSSLQSTTTSHAYLDQIMNTMGEAVIVFGDIGKVESANMAASMMLGFENEGVGGKKLFDLLAEADEDRDASSTFDGKLRMRDGSLLPVLLSFSDLEVNGKKGIVMVARDVSEYQKLEAKARDAAYQGGIAEMSTTVLHNIGNAINALTERSYQLGQDGKDLEKIADLFEGAFDEAKSGLEKCGVTKGDDEDVERFMNMTKVLPDALRKLYKDNLTGNLEKLDTGVSHIADIVRVQQNIAKDGAATVYLEKFDLKTTIEDAVSLIDASLESRGTKLHIEEIVDVGEVTLPRNIFIQAIGNLLKNAMEAIDDSDNAQNGEITVNLEAKERGMFLITVSDNGCGIDEQKQKQVFNFGYTEKEAGSGFGLHSVANFVQSLGGEIELLSDGVGKGATFLMLLPIKANKSNFEQHEDEVPAQTQSVVDDDSSDDENKVELYL